MQVLDRRKFNIFFTINSHSKKDPSNGPHSCTFNLKLNQYRFQYIVGTTSEWIFESDEDQMGVHSKTCYGPHRNALQKEKGTISECNPKCQRDHIGVHSLKEQGPHGSAFVFPCECIRQGPNGSALENLNRNHIGVHSYINLALGVHSHLVPIKNIECTPIWSLQLLGVHFDVVHHNF